MVVKNIVKAFLLFAFVGIIGFFSAPTLLFAEANQDHGDTGGDVNISAILNQFMVGYDKSCLLYTSPSPRD